MPAGRGSTGRRGLPRTRSTTRARAGRGGRRLPPRRKPTGYSAYANAARTKLKRFRRASLLAVGSTGIILMMFGAPQVAQPQDAAAQDTAALDTAPAVADTTIAAVDHDSATDPRASVAEATTTLQDLGATLYGLLPKLLIALALLLGAALCTALLKRLLRAGFRSWERASALSALGSVVIWMLALGAGLSVLAGDATALVGFVGFFGLALSWALQAPIESFSGWLLNSFRGYYRVGDRIEVGSVFGDVARIDVLTTMVWEAGGPDKSVQAAQATGALVTFPNSEVLRANIINYTRDFPYVWDEVTVGVSNASELAYAVRVFAEVGERIVGEIMAGPAETYRALLKRSYLDYEVSSKPQVYVSPTDSYTNLVVRYLVPARERRVWATRLLIGIAEELRRPEHAGRIIDGYPRQEIDVLDRDDDTRGSFGYRHQGGER